MNLSETIQALKAKGIQVAIDLGIHTRCLLDSNCPKVIELRRLLDKAGIGLPEILEGYQQVIVPDPINWSNDGFQVDGKVTVRIAGLDVQLDLTNFIESQLNRSVREKLDTIKQQEDRVRELGQSLYRRYQEEITNQRRKKTLPQLPFSRDDIIRYDIRITSDGDNYIFFLPAFYHPEYIVRDGVRYELAEEDKANLKRNIYLSFSISRDNIFISAVLLDDTGAKFRHYHGKSGECWGQIQLPNQWDKTLRSLDALKRSLIGALVTINYNSLLDREPPGMPHADKLRERSRELGREGVIEQLEITPPQRTRWGRG